MTGDRGGGKKQIELRESVLKQRRKWPGRWQSRSKMKDSCQSNSLLCQGCGSASKMSTLSSTSSLQRALSLSTVSVRQFSSLDHDKTTLSVFHSCFPYSPSSPRGDSSQLYHQAQMGQDNFTGAVVQSSGCRTVVFLSTGMHSVPSWSFRHGAQQTHLQLPEDGICICTLNLYGIPIQTEGRKVDASWPEVSKKL